MSRKALGVALLVLNGCATPITPAIPYAAWPVVADLHRQLDAPMPEAVKICDDDRRATYTGVFNGKPLDCDERLAAYRARRARLQAEFDYYTGPDYVQPPAQADAR